MKLYGVEAYPRSAWKANNDRTPRPRVKRYDYLEIHHSGGFNDKADNNPLGLMKSHQHYHMNVKKWWDVFYCAAIAPNGKLIDGRSSYSSVSSRFGEGFTVCLLGDYRTRRPTREQAITLYRLWEGMSLELKKPADVVTHRARAGDSECPGRLGADLAGMLSMVGFDPESYGAPFLEVPNPRDNTANVRDIQGTLNTVSGSDLVVDGVLGPLTMTAFNRMTNVYINQAHTIDKLNLDSVAYQDLIHDLHRDTGALLSRIEILLNLGLQVDSDGKPVGPQDTPTTD